MVDFGILIHVLSWRQQKHKYFSFHYKDFLTNFWHNNWHSIFDSANISKTVQVIKPEFKNTEPDYAPKNIANLYPTHEKYGYEYWWPQVHEDTRQFLTDRSCMYSETCPTSVFGLTGEPSFSPSPSPDAASRSSFHSLIRMSRRFIPPPSDQSIPTTLAESTFVCSDISVLETLPAKRLAAKDETREILSVDLYTWQLIYF